MKRALAIAAGLLALIIAVGSAPAESRGTTTTYPCQDVTGFSNTTLLIVTTVNPAGGMKWNFDDAPSVVAQRILTGLNGNSHGITFKEASGVVPNLFLNVTLSETNSGTQQDSAYASVTGLAKSGTLFSATSGTAPYIGWKDAVDHLSTDILSWLTGGWHTNPPCRLPDGSMRTHWP